MKSPNVLRSTRCGLLTLALLAGGAAHGSEAPYYPPPGDGWERRSAAALAMDAEKLAAAVAFAVDHESDGPRDLEQAHYTGFAREPFGDAVGPFKERGEPTGLIVRRGYVVAEWGDPERVDMTFSVSKSFLSTTVGLAWAAGLIRDLDDPVWKSMAPVVPADPGLASETGMDGVVDAVELFDTERERRITWNHLLRQTSDWEGTLWGKPDWADRPAGEPSTWLERERHPPGSVYEYNDVRVNLLALAATNVWREPLPRVLRREVMDEIGASNTWRWHGYENSWVVIDGLRVQVVSGGGHWGGGMWLSARDQARLGLLTLRRGRWGDQRLLPEAWFERALTPTEAEPGYGFMNYFLNTGRERFPAAPESAYAHLGAGVNMVYVDPEHDLVVVARWIDREALGELIRLVLASIEG